MTTPQLPPVVQQMIDATNRGDSAAFVGTFSDDAYLNDYGREFHGKDGAASWNSTDNIGVGAHFTLRGVRPGDGDGAYLVDITVTSHRFNGEGTFDIHVRDGLITRLVV
jgi:hypothetical protein